MAEAVTLLGCGDVGPIHGPTEHYGSLVRDTLLAADIRFAQVERVYSTRGALQPHSGGGHSRLPPAMASVFTDCGFNIVSVASNHAMDWGGEALLDTIDLLRDQGIQTIGAGRNLAEARRPAFIDCKDCGSRFWRIARSCMRDMPPARTSRASHRCAPIRATNRWTISRACRRGSSPHRTSRISRPCSPMCVRQGCGRQGRAVIALGHSFRAAADRRLSEDRGTCRVCGRSRRDPGASRACPEGDRGACRAHVLLQPQQLHHVGARQNRRGRGRVLRPLRRCSRPRLSASSLRHRRETQPSRKGRDVEDGADPHVVSAGHHRPELASGIPASGRSAFRSTC